jgi:hypothetical protein
MSSLEDVYDEGGRCCAIVCNLVALAGSLVAAVGFVVVAASLIAGFGFGTSDALAVAALLGGTLLLAGFLVRSVRVSGAGAGRSHAERSRADRLRGGRSGVGHPLVFTGVGTAVGLAGLVLFWTSLPAGWTGDLARLPRVALGTYAVGLLVLFWTGLDFGSAESARPETESAATSAESTDAARGASPRGASPADSESERGVGTASSLGGVGSPLGANAEEARSERVRQSSTVGDGGEDEGDLEFFDGDEKP